MSLNSIRQDRKNWGASKNQIDAEVQSSFKTYDILEPNIMAYQVYQRLRIEIQATMSGLIYTGHSREEIKSVMDILDIPKNKRIDTLDRLSIMEAEALKILNKRSQ